MKTRAKFMCKSVTDEGDVKSVKLHAVATGSEEDKAFWKWTPSGEITLSVLNPEVIFVPKKMYYIDFTEAEG